MNSELLLVKDEDGYWEQWFLDGRLLVEGHRVSAVDLLKALGRPFTVTQQREVKLDRD